ncbi:tetratricopeptide repeat protein [Solidesulfovibrio sp.]
MAEGRRPLASVRGGARPPRWSGRPAGARAQTRAGVLAGVLAVLVWLVAALPARAGLEEGRAAWQGGDFTRAFEEFLPLAAAGDSTLQNQIAAMYYTGQGVPQDFTKAAEWFKKAATAGSPEAQYCLGKLYYHGQGVPQNFEDAVKWLTDAALGGKGGAQFLLATLQLYGKGIEANPVKAYFWTLLAVAAPDLPAEDKPAAMALRDQIQATLSKRQIESMQTMVRHWAPRKGLPAPAPAAAPRRGG